jgi:hypothetical protein
MNPQDKAKSKARGRSKAASDQGRSGQAAPPAARPVQPAESDWRERAAFRVLFDQTTDQAGAAIWRTRAYREETDDPAEWPGVAVEALIGWMRDKAMLPIELPSGESQAARSAAESTAEPSADSPVEASATEQAIDLRLEIANMSVTEVPAEQQVSGPPIPKRLRAQIDFHLSNTAAYLITASQTSYAIQVLAHDLETGGAILLASDQQPLRLESLDYSPALDFDLPALGRYQLVGMVLLPDDSAVGVTLGPMLTVVA